MSEFGVRSRVVRGCVGRGKGVGRRCGKELSGGGCVVWVCVSDGAAGAHAVAHPRPRSSELVSVGTSSGVGACHAARVPPSVTRHDWQLLYMIGGASVAYVPLVHGGGKVAVGRWRDESVIGGSWVECEERSGGM